MATIKSILEFQDKMSAIIDKVSKSLENATIKSNATQKAIDSLEKEQIELQQAFKNTDNAVQSANNSLNNMQNASNNTANGINNMQGKIITLASAFQLFNQVKSIISGVNAKINEFISYTETEMRVQDQLSIITKQRMGLVDDEIRSLYNLASAQQQIGVVGDEVTVAGMAGIAAFVRQKSSIESLTPAMNNLAVKMYGYNATAESMDMISKSLGKAMLGDVGALSRMGIKIDDNQKKWLMSLKEEQRAIELSKMITDVTGDMNKEMAKTPFGQMTQANNRLSDSYERLGAILLPLQVKFIEVWSNIVEKIVNNLDTVVPLVITGLTTVGLAFVALKAQAIGSAIATASAWVSAAAPFLAIIGIIGAVSVALNKMGIDFRQQAENILISFNWVITAIENLIIGIQNIGIAWQKAWAIIKRSGEDIQFKEFKANDYYTNQEKAQKQLNTIGGGLSTSRALLGSTGKGGAFDSSLITSTAGGKALKTKNQGEIEINGEDLQLLHDMATRDYMVKYSQQNLTPQVNFPNVVIHETADVDSVVENLVNAVTDLAQSKLVVS